MEEYLAIIKMFAGNFAPRGYMFCHGQILSIASNTALFSLIGTTYGGNGTTTFALPDLQGRVPVGAGQAPGLEPIQLGQMGGSENVTILTTQMPAHNHTAQVTVAPPVNTDGANSDSPEGCYLAPSGSQIYNSAASPGAFAGSFQAQASIGVTGGSQPLPIRNPYLGMNYVICVEGLFPPRN